jgi:hypothetical protein
MCRLPRAETSNQKELIRRVNIKLRKSTLSVLRK